MPELTTRISSPAARPALMRDVSLMRRCVGLARGSRKADLNLELNKALHFAGYLATGQRTEFDDDTELALKAFQRYALLPTTGVVDDRTLIALAQPRFDDLPDLPAPVTGPGGTGAAVLTAARRYVDELVSWPKRDVTFGFQGFTSDPTHQEVQTVVRDAFATWAEVTPLKFYETADSADADIRIRFATSDSPRGALAVTTRTSTGNTLDRVDIAFDEDEAWSAVNRATSEQAIDLFVVAVHELGHALGLGHSSSADAIMYAYYQPRLNALTQDDVNGITAKYGSDSDKNVIAETAFRAPGAVAWRGRSYLSWAANDAQHGLNVLASRAQGVFTDRVTLSDSSPTGVSMCVFDDRLVMAWTSADGPLHLMSSPDGIHWGHRVTLAETSFARPVLASHRDRLVIGWTGTNTAHSLNVMWSSDGIHWGNRHTLADSSIDGPALASFGDRLFIAWTGINTGHNLNVMSTEDEGANWQNKRILGHSSLVGPSLLARGNRLFMGWSGAEDRRLNVLASANGLDFGTRRTLGDASGYTPVLLEAYGRIAFAWTGCDGAQHLNVITLSL